MFAPSRDWTRSLVLAAALLAAPAWAADAERYLPADTESVVIVNVKQFLDSKLVKKANVVSRLKAAIKGNKEADDLLKAMNFDPFKDLDKIIAAAPGDGQQDKGVVIVQGRFDPDKIQAAAEKAARDHKDMFTIRTGPLGRDMVTYYEIKIGEPGQLVFAAAGKSILFAAPSKDYLLNALKTARDNTRPSVLTNKDFAGLVKTLDDKQSLSFAMPGHALSQGPLADLPIKEDLAKISSITGGITITDGIKVEVAVSVKTADDVKALHKRIDEGLQTGVMLLSLAAMNQAELRPLLEMVQSIKTAANDKIVTIKGEADAGMIDRLINSAPGK